MCLAQGLNAVMPVRLEPAALQARVKNSTTVVPDPHGEAIQCKYCNTTDLTNQHKNYLYMFKEVKNKLEIVFMKDYAPNHQLVDKDDLTTTLFTR